MEAKLRMSVRGLEDSDGAQGLDEQEAELACKRVYDETEKVVDFRKKRVTDTGLDKRITLPGRLRAGKQTPSSLNNAQQRGRESILKREREGELIVVLTDKSGKRAVMTPEIYHQLMEPHITGDTIHTRDEVDQAEKQFNGAAAQILKVFKVGEDWRQEDWHKSAHSVRHNMVPSLSQQVIDHKDKTSVQSKGRSSPRWAAGCPGWRHP